MADMLEQCARWLDDQRHQHMTRSVSYTRGSSTIEVQATIGRTEFEQADDFGIVHKVESRDYLIRTADLVLDGQPTLPKRGDQIRETDGSTTKQRVSDGASTSAQAWRGFVHYQIVEGEVKFWWETTNKNHQ